MEEGNLYLAKTLRKVAASLEAKIQKKIKLKSYKMSELKKSRETELFQMKRERNGKRQLPLI